MKKKILLCVTGGIAAYKAIDLASRLSKAGYEVKTVLTSHAQRFVAGINFAAITQNSVHTTLWEDNDPIPHITLADWADLIVVAPATANIMAKAAYGIADDLLSSLLLAHLKPVLFVPAMNVHMYDHPATQANIALLKKRGNHVLEPVTGLLACGYEGKGKYPPNEEVVFAIRCYLEHPANLSGKKVLVTAGATSEPLDPMRTLTNKSSGKMGLAIARAFALRGARVTLVHGNVSETLPYYLHKAVFTPTVQEMADEVLRAPGAYDIIVKCAAVSDFRPAKTSAQKIKKGGKLALELVPTQDILAELGRVKPKKQILVGFAAETENLAANAKVKLERKNLDLICVNHLDTAGADETALTLIFAKNKKSIRLEGDKFAVALQLVGQIAKP
ncbi:MAG: bifunctional phosphopantothenoylcysteine decarboxylase/phosphopantothenate--cysteine ligase CoaBC [Candidatus Syntrophosphaera sp.]|nr:bifunctional phosphopantothenoylcysteine decarboxylase/phosphopantothenate--cysteine ligase CoaBC [Candidatus Syntrophosphaera sp.]